MQKEEMTEIPSKRYDTGSPETAFGAEFEPLRSYKTLFCAIDELLQSRGRAVVAIDGNCAAGKTSLAGSLKSAYSCNVFAVDDFFLRVEQRTPERLAEPGGNIDYERFQREIIEPLSHEKPFAYRPYDCATLEFVDPVSVEPTDLSVIEGVYSLHPLFLPAYDIKVFLALDENEQRRRLRMRSAELFDRFVDEWIPMENRYFEHYRVAENCDFVFYAGLPGKYQFYSDGGTAVRGE